jgi:hypothetical protein
MLSDQPTVACAEGAPPPLGDKPDRSGTLIRLLSRAVLVMATALIMTLAMQEGPIGLIMTTSLSAKPSRW